MLRMFLGILLVMPAAAQPKDWPLMPRNAAELLEKHDVNGLLDVLSSSAKAGDAVSMFWLGRVLEDFEGGPHDYAQAMHWYREAAVNGVGAAAWSLGRLYELGRGAPRDPGEAQKWYSEAARLGCRRTALTIIEIRWFSGPGELRYEPAPATQANPHPPGLTAAELDILRKAGLRGRLVWQAGEPGAFGLPARVVLIAQKQVDKEVTLAAPYQGSAIYVQGDNGWQRYGDAKFAERTLRIQPQSPEMTSVTIDLENGGSSTHSAWGWRR
jgi:hypothetical protein